MVLHFDSLSVFFVDFPNYKNNTESHIYDEFLYTEMKKTMCEEKRTEEFCSKFAQISFIAFEEL